MAPTTLFTFLFDCPSAAHSVELLGSWDNFTKAYRLKRDLRKGSKFWSGCFTFENIICDGNLKNIGEKRNGALQMGGTYWYYYKVDDEEHHNPMQPSTTFCPLLPGQRLNVLEMPMELSTTGDTGGPDLCHAFTRNPQDKFRNPKPPKEKPLPSPRVGDLRTQSYSVSAESLEPPRSASSPQSQSVSSGSYRRARTSSRSRAQSSDGSSNLQGPKSKAPRSSSSNKERRKPSKNIRNLEIGAPVLVSTTAEDIHLVPLPSHRIPWASASAPPSITGKLREFAPLSSHPVNPEADFPEGITPSRHGRKRSHSVTVPSSTFNPGARNLRANTLDSKPSSSLLYPASQAIAVPQPPMAAASFQKAPLPLLQRLPTLDIPRTQDERPQSRRGGGSAGTLRKSPLVVGKDLPELPRYLVPAPLFACNDCSALGIRKQEEQEGKAEFADAKGLRDESELNQIRDWNPVSHFSFSSIESAMFSDDDQLHSPTFSSMTNSTSDICTPSRFSYLLTLDAVKQPAKEDNPEDNGSEFTKDGSDATPPIQDTPPLDASLLQLDIHRSSTGSRRQAAVFGLSEGLKLLNINDNEKNQSQTTIIKAATPPAISPMRPVSFASVSAFDDLLNEFGYLGHAVV